MWLFKCNHFKDITPVYLPNLAKSLHCFVTTGTSLTFSIYLGAMYIVYNRWLYVWLFKFNHLKGYYPCISSQLGEKFTLLRYDANIIDLFNLFGIHMYIVYNRWFYVRLFKFNHLKHITPVYHRNLVRNLHCYVTTRTSLTFSIYLGAMYIVCYTVKPRV